NRILRYRKPTSLPADQQPVPDLCIGQSSFNTRTPNAPNQQIGNQGILLNSGNGTVFTGAIAFDTNKNLWFTDSGNNRVLRFPASAINSNSTSGSTVFLPTADLEIGQLDFVSKQPTLPSSDTGRRTRNQLNTPTAIAFDSAGRLYVGDTNGSDPYG